MSCTSLSISFRKSTVISRSPLRTVLRRDKTKKHILFICVSYDWHLQLVQYKNLKWLLISFRVETKDTRSVEGRWHGDSSGSDNRGRWLLWDCDTRTCRDSRTEHSSPVKHRKFYFCLL